MTSWHSYPSIYTLGHRYVADILLDPVLVEEKVDGSQFSFGKFVDESGHEFIRCRSKGTEINVLAPDKMFKKGVEYVQSIRDKLIVGWTYRGEYLHSPKHNALVYDRVPYNNIIIFDINTAEETYLPFNEKHAEAKRIGLETVTPMYYGLVTDIHHFRSFLDTTSILGGQKVEGVVIKNYCVTPHHKTLMSSLDWAPIGDLKEGDDIIAFSENGVGPLRSRYYQAAKVEHVERATTEVLEIEFEDNSVLQCTSNHPLLIHPLSKSEYVWRECSKLLGNESTSRFLQPWLVNESYKAGYLAGIFDGEGHMIHRQPSLHSGVVEIGFSQNPGTVAETSLKYLDGLGFKWAVSKSGNSPANKYYLLGGKGHALSFLGTIKPKRLLEKFNISCLGGIKSRYTQKLRIRSIRPIGRKEIVELQTSTGTYFTDGFASHNSRFGQDKKVLLGKFVSEAYKEVHNREWKAANPSQNDVVLRLVDSLKTPARWHKAVQHLRDAGQLEDSPRDIGLLMKEVPLDIEKEEVEYIKTKLYEWAWPHIRRGVTAGVPEWYKDELLKRQFSESTPS